MLLSDYLSINYPFTVQAEADGGFVIEFPDLPGCMTQVDTADEVFAAAQEIRELWIETAHELGRTIPVLEEAPEYSGKFMTRISTSLHRDLAVAAKKEHVSLNQYVFHLLAQGYVLQDNRNHLERIERTLDRIASEMPKDVYTKVG
jgi:antitoxin HicB